MDKHCFCKICRQVTWARRRNSRQPTKTLTKFFAEKIDDNRSRQKLTFRCILLHCHLHGLLLFPVTILQSLTSVFKNINRFSTLNFATEFNNNLNTHSIFNGYVHEFRKNNKKFTVYTWHWLSATAFYSELCYCTVRTLTYGHNGNATELQNRNFYVMIC